MPYRLALLSACILLTGCAGKPFPGGPIVDMKGVNQAQYRVDLDECSVYADEVAVGQQAATGAVAGAVLGGLIGAAVGNSDDAREAAGAGAVIGGAKGVGRGVGERRMVVRNCLRRRGYAVLN
jgi:outer membrane lipoprotein SlyB